MKWRLTVLTTLLFLRLLFNFAVTSQYRLGEQVRIRYDHYKIERSKLECIIKEGIFWVKDKDFCFLPEGEIGLVSGTLSAGLIDKLLGRIWLDQSSDYTIGESKNGKKSLVENYREKLTEGVLAGLPSPEGELVLGVVMGYKSALPRLFYDQLIRSGTVHIVVASGYNVMIVASLMLSVTLLFWRRRVASGLAILLVWFYVALSGGEVSLIRAALMGGLVLIGLAWGRSTRITWSLLLIVVLMLVLTPTLIESISFQLSVAATIGVAVVGPLIKRKWGKEDRLDLTTIMGAMMMTAPLIWWHFGRVSWISLVSNVVILPLVPLLMLLGGLTLVVGIAAVPLLPLVSWPTYALAHLIVVVVSFFGRT